MFDNVFLKTLRDQRRGLFGWGLATALLVIAMAALWPSFKDIPDLEKFLESYPEALRTLFNIEAITTGAGYFNAELYTIMLPVMFLVFSIARGARFIAGEEADGSLEILLSSPMPRSRIAIQQAAALAVSVAFLGVVLFVAVFASSTVLGMDIGAVDALGGSIAMGLLGLEHGLLALALGAFTGRRSIATGGAAAVAAAGYVLYVVAQFSSAIEPWGIISPFKQAIGNGPLGDGVPVVFVWMPIAGIVAVVASLRRFEHRDILV